MSHKMDCFYQEIRKNSVLVKEDITNKPADVEEPLAFVCLNIFRLSTIARKEGLLSLEEAVTGDSMPEILLKDELVKIALLIVDGTDPEIVTDISMKRYFAKNYTGLEGLAFLTIMDGILGIQAMDNPRILEESIRSYMPDEVNETLDMLQNEEEKKNQKECKDSWEKLFEKDSCNKGKSYSYTLIPLNYCLINMRKEDAKMLITRADDLDLSLLLKVLDGKACRVIRDSIAEERAQVVIRDMEYSGPSRYRDIEKSADTLFQDMLKLGKADIIRVPASLDKVFEIRDDSQEYGGNRYRNIRNLFLGMDNRCIQRVLKEVPEKTLSCAMKGWDTDLRRLIYGNLPKPVAGIISENIKYVSDDSWQIDEACKEIEQIIQRLEDSAMIIINDVTI